MTLKIFLSKMIGVNLTIIGHNKERTFHQVIFEGTNLDFELLDKKNYTYLEMIMKAKESKCFACTIINNRLEINVLV